MESFGKEIPGNKTEDKIYIVMNKPKGCVCSAVSDSHRTVYELLTPELQYLVANAKRGHRLHTVGRLDCETSGLLIITTDGYLSDFLTRKENHIEKTYIASLKGSVPLIQQAEYIEKAASGLTLPPEKKAPQESALPCKLEWIDEQHVKVTVTEGKFHEVKRIFTALGNEVTELKRMTICNLNLEDFDLSDGQYKCISKQEIAGLLFNTTDCHSDNKVFLNEWINDQNW